MFIFVSSNTLSLCRNGMHGWSLNKDGFSNALTGMVARRGWPRDMLSDMQSDKSVGETN